LKRASRALGIAIGLLGVAFVVRELSRNREEVLDAAAGADPWLLALAFVLGLASMASIGVGWRRCLRELGAHLALSDALRRYFVGQLGKYVPGGIWPVVGRAEMARRGGVAPGVAYASTVLSLGLTYLAAILASAGALVMGAAGGSQVTWQPVVALLPLGVLALHPAVVGRLLHALRRLSRRQLAIPVPNWTTSITLLLLHLPAWLGIGLATWLIAVALAPGSVDVRNLVFAATLSWVVGFFAVGVPGGIGVREAVFVAAATSVGSSGMAAAVAVVARATFILVDLGGAGLLTLVAGRAGPTAGSSSASPSGNPRSRRDGDRDRRPVHDPLEEHGG
jgi:glycosyltransferase 2 family protein